MGGGPTRLLFKPNQMLFDLQLQLNNVIMEMNCKSVVDAFRSLRTDLLEFGSLIRECKFLASMGSNLTLCLVKKAS